MKSCLGIEEFLVDCEFTGRLMYGRRYNDGLHQAIEAKEGVKVERESMTQATITFQNFFRMYKKLSGMTGTAQTEEAEFYLTKFPHCSSSLHPDYTSLSEFYFRDLFEVQKKVKLKN